MSIGIALQCNRYTIVYGDSQRVDFGKSTAPCNKTFQFHGVIGCYTGLVEWASKPAGEHIRAVFAACRPTSAGHAIDLLEMPILSALSMLPADWSKGLHVIVATEVDIARIEFDGTTPSALKHYATDTWMAIGSDLARDAAIKALAPMGDGFTRLNRAKAELWIANAVRGAIAHGGPHPNAPSEPACVGPINKRGKP